MYYNQPDDDTGIKVVIVLAGIAAILIAYFRRRRAADVPRHRGVGER